MRLIASSPTLERMEKTAQRYFFSPNVRIVDNKVFNSKGEIEGIVIIKKKSRYRMESTD